MMYAIAFVVGAGAGFVFGVLFGRKNRNRVEGTVSNVKNRLQS